jgi:hypothetical protein
LAVGSPTNIQDDYQALVSMQQRLSFTFRQANSIITSREAIHLVQQDTA